jgi:hypothetical protein
MPVRSPTLEIGATIKTALIWPLSIRAVAPGDSSFGSELILGGTRRVLVSTPTAWEPHRSRFGQSNAHKNTSNDAVPPHSLRTHHILPKSDTIMRPS